MIVEMSRVFIAVRLSDKDRLLRRLGELELMHFEPVDPQAAVADKETLQAIADLERGLQILSPVAPATGQVSAIEPLAAAREAIAIENSLRENRARLDELHRLAGEFSIWGDARIAQFRQLREAGIRIGFFAVPRDLADRIEAEHVHVFAALPGKRVLAAVIERSGAPRLPDAAEAVSPPQIDRPSIRKEAAAIDARIQTDLRRLTELARLGGALRAAHARLSAQAEYMAAGRSGETRGDLFAVQGWMPTDAAAGIDARLSEHGPAAGIQMRPADAAETPPTLIRYPVWAKPIKGLFDILGTVPGYREMDLSPFFMAAMPLFTAMLIGDAGYGFVISLAALVLFRRLARSAGRPQAQLILIFGLSTLVWGILTGNYFGITPQRLAASSAAGAALASTGGLYSRAAHALQWAAPLWRENPRAGQYLIIKIALVIGCLHLVLAHLRKAVEFFPDQRTLAEFGWIVALVDMLVLIWYLIFIGFTRTPRIVWGVVLGALLLVSGFSRPDKKGFTRIAVGLIGSLLPLLGTFSDTMSYIRLFAVGLASYYIASAFNTLAVQAAAFATWFAAASILIVGHGLNIGLAAIAVFAHGVRLNMLEFSNNAGVQWAGYGYRPFGLKMRRGTGRRS